MQAILRQLQRMVTADTAQQLWLVFVETMTSYGFDRMAYGLSRSHKLTLNPANQDLGFFTNITDEHGNLLIDHTLLMRTPMYRWALHNKGACSWNWSAREFAAGRLTPEEEEAYAQRQATGVAAGFTISFIDPAMRGLAVLSLGARNGLSQDEVDTYWGLKGEEIEMLAEVMHLKMRSLPLPIRRRQLSRRQLEALEWVAAGKTTQDIATIMGVSAAMVEKHLKLVRETLDVGTTAHAVAKAAMLNHLFAISENHEQRED